MKFKPLPFLLAAALLIPAGCADEVKNADNKHDKDDALNGNPMDSYNDKLVDGQVGYVRFKSTQLDQKKEQQRKIKVNKEQVADMVTRMILTYDGFEDVATLVTDNKVLVAYRPPEGEDRNRAADMVQKTAYSLVPSFYHVYVSDQPSAFGDIQSLSTSTVYDKNYNSVIDSVVNKMKKAPQGKTTPNNAAENMKEEMGR
ncbi:YhcN/YlaJ family sporulation lipoprotein [Halobacillus salinarum]|uniref:YhcN/YlaJ family sporulation lipoprotein n=1 Tax=Halobacillus salinarum TaxID=2932257 RepID=A0ABY4EPX6_9BACI|nr:YhcN/YlaJ family sporulation lipoprotein [Halobacillus salinarum]UOQ46040.1 YhcN/YlaJ family sporulation lipoprotein [Halobacillus salinarum]